MPLRGIEHWTYCAAFKYRHLGKMSQYPIRECHWKCLPWSPSGADVWRSLVLTENTHLEVTERRDANSIQDYVKKELNPTTNTSIQKVIYMASASLKQRKKLIGFTKPQSTIPVVFGHSAVEDKQVMILMTISNSAEASRYPLRG
uniref:MSP domain-containing protein n=1 Tax=Steinernema glaseri TaxID=37863 RepID=A0A1I7ZFQ3_9BILA